MQAQDLVADNLKLVSLPDVYINVKSVLDDPDSGLADVARVIEHDPGMTARLLRIANSAFFGFASRIDTVSRAVNLLGAQQIHDLVLATAVAQAFRGLPSGLMDMDMFWHNSVYRAVAARLLAARCNVLDSERLFVAGLLSDLGHLIMYQTIAEEAAEALAQAQASGSPLYRIERALLGFDYAQVGGELMRAWKLPESLQETVRWHTEPDKAETFLLETAIVHVALLTSEIAQGNTSLEDATIDQTASRITGLAEDGLETIMSEVDRQVADAVALIFSDRRKTA